MNDCIFCKIAKGEIPATVLYEDDSVLAILDIMPANFGHVLVITKEHFELVSDVPEEVFLKVSRGVHRLSKTMKQVLPVEGFNLLQNNGKVSGQVIPHFHYHIIPRVTDDKVTIAWEHLAYTDNGQAIAASIKDKL